MTAPIPFQQWQQLLAAEMARIRVESAAVVLASTRAVEQGARRNSVVSSGRSAARAPSTIRGTVSTAGFTTTGAIEYAGRGQGTLGHVLEFGGGRDHSPPHRDLGRALDDEDVRFVNALANVAAVGSVSRT